MKNTTKSKEITQDNAQEVNKEASIFTKLRYNRKFRLGFILVLLVIVGILMVVWEKARIALVIAFIALLAAFGLEATKNDFDLGKLWQTKSLQESKVSRDTAGNILFDRLGNITTDSSKGKKSDDYNCADFSTQPEAQAFFEKVGGKGNDVNRLDGDKNGVACQDLPSGAGKSGTSEIKKIACTKESYVCGDFKFQEDAQEIFDACASKQSIVKALDGNSDGKACESLPSKSAR